MIWQEQELSVPRKKRHIQFREKNETAPALSVQETLAEEQVGATQPLPHM